MSFSFNEKIHQDSSVSATYYTAHANVTVNDDGTYSGTITIDGTYNYTMTILFKSTAGDSITIASASGKGKSSTGTGTLDTSKTWALYGSCNDTGCDAWSGGNAKLSDDFTLHTHSAPSGGAVHLYDYLDENNKAVSKYTDKLIFGWDSPTNWGCSDAKSWQYSYDGVSFVTGNDTNQATRSDETPGKSCDFWIKLINTHDQERTIGPATFRTRYATPKISVSNDNEYNNKSEISASTNYIKVLASNGADYCGTLTWYFSIDDGEFKSNGTTKSYTFKNLDPGSSHKIKVRATNPDGDYNEKSITIRTRCATPKITLENTKQLTIGDNTYSGRSKTTDSITVKATNSTDDCGTLTWYFSKNGGDKYYKDDSTGNTASYTFSDLSSGTTYSITAYAKNEDGDTSNTVTLSIRTKYSSSNFTNAITINDKGLEHVIFTPTVKYGTEAGTVSSAIYAISGGDSANNDGCSKVSLTVSSKQIAKTTSAYCLTPSTKYTITVHVYLVNTYDAIDYTFTGTFTTDAKCTFSRPLNNKSEDGALSFVMPDDVLDTYTIKNPSGNNVRCDLYTIDTSAGGYKYICSRYLTSGWGEAQNLVLTDDEWDSIYKIMGNSSNDTGYLWRVNTYSNRYKNYTTYREQCTGTLTLNGKKKTLHIGTGNHRAAVFVGVKNGNSVVAKRAVVWVGGSDGKPHRCI